MGQAHLYVDNLRLVLLEDSSSLEIFPLCHNN